MRRTGRASIDMNKFRSVSSLRQTNAYTKKVIQASGVLTVGRRTYEVRPALQQVVPASSPSACDKLIKGLERLFGTHEKTEVACLTQLLFDTSCARNQRLRTPSSVEQGWIVFKDTSLRSAEQVLGRLLLCSDAQLKLSAEGEVKLLFERAMCEVLLKRPAGCVLQALVQDKAAYVLAKKQMPSVSLERLREEGGIQVVLGQWEAILGAEVEALKTVHAHQAQLLKCDLGATSFSTLLEESDFNPQGLADDVERAALWVVNAPRSTCTVRSPVEQQAQCRDLLREYATNGQSLIDPVVLRHLQGRLLPGLKRGFRASALSEGRRLSSVTGDAMLEQHLSLLNEHHELLGKQLFAAVLGYQGEPRMGRLLYAIAELRQGRFRPLALRVERALQGV